MFAVRVSFPVLGELSRTAAAANDLLSCWYKNGQILEGSWILADRRGAVEAFVRTPEARSLDALHNNRYANEALAGLAAAPTVEVLGVEPESACACSCTSRSGMVLFTHYLSTDPPVRCLDCFGPVPLYLLPHVHDEEHLVLLHWAADYRACDTLQMHCTTGERFGERQLFEHDSSLSRNGRKLCADLEQVTETPVYYFLHKTRSHGREAELARVCPSCGAPWRLEQRLHNFDFQCPTCRLLSAVAADAS